MKHETIILRNKKTNNKLGIFTYIFFFSLWFFNRFVTNLSPNKLDFLVLFVFLKIIESYLMLNIKLDFKKQSISFQKSFKKITITDKEIEKWKIVSIIVRGRHGMTKSYYFECYLQNKMRFVYPLPGNIDYSYHKYYSRIFEKILDPDKKELNELGRNVYFYLSVSNIFHALSYKLTFFFL